DQLLFGEAVALKSSRVLDRRGRSLVRVRIVGRSSLGWVEAAEAWGCNVEAVVVTPLREMNNVIHLVSRFSTTAVSAALTMPPMGDWDGLMLATVNREDEATLVNRMFDAWQPWIAIIAYPPRLSRSAVLRLGPHLRSSYEKRTIKCRHTDVGGVTTSSWTLLHFSRLRSQSSRPSLMTMKVYPRPLQTALDDTVGGRWCEHQNSFEPREDLGMNVLGTIVDKRDGIAKSLYSAKKLGPDISTLKGEDRFFWVSAASVMSKNHVLRRVKIFELFAVWDYEGKLESSEWSHAESIDILRYRTLSPPAKMIRLFLGKAADAIVQEVMGARSLQNVNTTPGSLRVGMTKDIPFTPMEVKVDTRVEAKLADDAEVNLSTWAIPGETESEIKARIVLRQFAVRWWAYNLEKKAWLWWHAHGKDPIDAEAITDCIRRVKACTYWQWVRGSRLMPWQCSPEFHNDFRDGIEFWHIGAAPKGMVHNLQAPSREAEIEARKKVFKLKFQGNLDSRKFVSLCVPCFSIKKIVKKNVVLDIRVIWDSKSNGHNATLWAPGFMLDDAGDLVELVVKWLTVPISQYIEEGSPPQDYTQTGSIFIKSKQGGVDVGGMFHNFRAHAKEQANLGVRWIETRNDGGPERHEFLRFNVLHFGGKCSPYLSKWTRLKAGLDWIWDIARDADVIDTGELRRVVGLAVNVTEVYSDCRPYLKGIFNALESWRWDRDLDGWRLQQVMEEAAELELNDASRAVAEASYPLETKITSEMLMHVEALRVLFSEAAPLAIPVLRPTDVEKLRYVIGDASAEGFGAGTQYPD
ncbi:hypothetical protein ACHAXR_004033, partial [Thalassiosira sp. AJA248-18]